ncbi:MAG: hypothetical protein QOI02_1740 [Actinomycetota bacterium]|nr:hypothetical protein [Actinomycetota bacterium]
MKQSPPRLSTDVDTSTSAGVRLLAALLRGDDEHEDEHQCEREHDGCAGETGCDSCGEQVVRVEATGACRREDADEDAEAETRSELMRDGDEPGRCASVLFTGFRDAGGGEWAEGGALADAVQNHGQGDAGEVWGVLGEAAEPGQADERKRDARREHASVAQAMHDARERDAGEKGRDGHR